MRTILVTGGAGFMGANFVHHFLNAGDHVVLFDDLSRKGADRNLAWLKGHAAADELEIIIGDVRTPPATLRRAVERSDALFHFAAQVAVTTSVTAPRDDFSINALGTFNLLELVRTSNGKRPVFFYASTNKVYGGMDDVATSEGTRQYAYRDLPHGISEVRPLDFHSPYGCSKGCADQYVRDYARIYGLQTVVFRQSCIYGCRQFGVEDQGWVAWFLIAAVLNRPLTIYGDGKQVRDVLFVDDLIAAYERAWQHIDTTAGQVYNIGGGPANAISLLDLLDYMECDLRLPISRSTDGWRPGDQPVYISDIRRAQEHFGWTPDTEWRRGVRQLADWVGSNRDMLAQVL